MTIPDMPPGWETAWHCWSDCSSCRQIGMAAGAIPWTALQAWTEKEGLGEIEAEEIIQVAQAIDAGWLEAINTKPKILTPRRR